jgi:hypothetical protein
MLSNVAIQGNLCVVGTVTYSNSTVITTNDLNLELANNQSTQAGINGAGLYLGNGVNGPLVTWLFSNGNTQWQSNVGIGPTANATLNLGTTSLYWSNVYAASYFGTTVSVVGNVIAGNVTTVGNVSANYLLGNIWYATGYDDAYIFNGTSNIAIVNANGNATANIGGTANVMVLASTGQYITGVVSVSGNILGSNISLSGNVYANTITTTAGSNGNLTLDPDGSGDVVLPNNTELFVLSTATGAVQVTGGISVAGNIVTSNITATGTVNLTSTAIGNTLQVYGNIATTNGYLLGNGAFITGITGGGGGGLANGATNAAVPVASGNITFNIGGYSNTAVMSPGQIYSYGGFATPKNIGTSAFGNVSIGGNVNAILVGPITLAAGFTISVTTDSTAYVYGKLLNDSL